MFKKRKKAVKLSNEELESKSSYDFIMNLADTWLKEYKENKQCLELLDYLISALTKDLCTGGVVYPLIREFASPFTDFLPLVYYDENGNRHSVKTEDKVEVDLANTEVYLCPWDNKRIPLNLFNLLSTHFTYDENNHFSDFYTDINLCHVYNGNHSVNIGRYLKKGKIYSVVCVIEQLYPHCITDGVYWYNAHSGEALDKVSDFRIAAIYSLAQRRHQYKNS